jgi:MYXO-CTERM domain-containing protein
LVFNDEAYPANNVSRTTMKLVVEDSNEGGCECTTPVEKSAAGAMLALAAFGFAVLGRNILRLRRNAKSRAHG